MKLCVIGTGYVGLVASATYAEWGNTVTGVDIDQQKLDMISAGVMPIFEPGLAELVLKNMSCGRLAFTTSLVDGMKDAQAVFICVGTPEEESGAADLRYVWNVAKDIGKNIQQYTLVVTKSTVPVGTNERVKEIVAKHARGVPFDVVSCPEFLRQGSSVYDTNHPDRTVIGSDSSEAIELLAGLYQHLDAPILKCDLRSAEMIKYASNAFLAAKITFAMEMAIICEKGDADIEIVTRGMGLDKRIGPDFLKAGIGWGGSCFPKDVSALQRVSYLLSYGFRLLSALVDVNSIMHKHFIHKVKLFFGTNMNDLTFAVLGAAFKGNTDDIRESIAIKVIQRLRGYGARIRLFDPQAMGNAQKVLGDLGIEYCDDAYDTMSDADALFILTDWKEFAELNLKKVHLLLKKQVIFDGRNLLNREDVQRHGFTYFAVGRPTNGLDFLKKKSGKQVFAVLTNGNGSDTQDK
jgi:UDPglucose 6-dehydrogenase